MYEMNKFYNGAGFYGTLHNVTVRKKTTLQDAHINKRLCYKVYCHKTSMLQDHPSCEAEKIYG